MNWYHNLRFEKILLFTYCVFAISYLLGFFFVANFSSENSSLLLSSNKIPLVQLILANAANDIFPQERARISITYSLQFYALFISCLLIFVSGFVCKSPNEPFNQNFRSFSIVLAFNFLSLLYFFRPEAISSHAKVSVISATSDLRFVIAAACFFFTLCLFFMIGFYFGNFEFKLRTRK